MSAIARFPDWQNDMLLVESPVRRILWSLVVIGVLSTGGARGQSDGDEVQFQIACLAWQNETTYQRFLDGPQFRDACLQYLNSRSQKQIAADQKFQEEILKDAQKQWDEYEKKHGTKAQARDSERPR